MCPNTDVFGANSACPNTDVFGANSADPDQMQHSEAYDFGQRY